MISNMGNVLYSSVLTYSGEMAAIIRSSVRLCLLKIPPSSPSSNEVS